MNKLKFLSFIHPAFFAVFPIVFLFADNLGAVNLPQLWFPMLASVAVAALLFLLSWLIFKNTHKAGLVTSLLVLLFYMYRPVYTVAQTNALFQSLYLHRHRQLMLLFILVGALTIYLINKQKKPLQNLTYIINATALILVLPSFFQIGFHFLQAPSKKEIKNDLPRNPSKPLPTNAPDIYYFILDGYARHDVLQEVYGYNNEPFLKQLEQRGFYIARNSTSNYCQTILSLASSLNMNYLQNLPEYKNYTGNKGKVLVEMIAESAARKELRKFGYKFMTFASGFYASEIKNADRYWESATSIHFDEFENALLNSTPLPDLALQFFQKNIFYGLHRKLVLFPFQKLPEAVTEASPKFVFVHIVAPHPPFVFGPNGEEVQADRPFNYYDGSYFIKTGGSVPEYINGYKGQVQFLNPKILAAVDTILAASKTPPVIILQGDHSARLHLDWDDEKKTRQKETFSVLSAYHFPGKDTTGLYPEISQVNNFRLILNKYFAANLPMLPTRNYYSLWDRRHDYIDVTERVRTEALKPPKK